MEALTTALVSGFTDIASDMLGAIGSIVPAALPVMGGVAVVGIGVGIFKKVAHK